MGEALGIESQANDVQILLGPGVNMKRSSLGGRNFEYFSEDSVLVGKIAVGFINGVQSQGVEIPSNTLRQTVRKLNACLIVLMLTNAS